MPIPDFRVQRGDVARLSEDAYFWALVEPTWPEDEGTALLRLQMATIGQRILYSTILLSREVSNGGLFHTFWNQEVWIWALAQNSFHRLGAMEQSRALLVARDLLDKRRALGPLDARRAYLDGLPKKVRHRLADLDKAFYNEERFYPLYHSYITAHPGEFFRT